jgi:phage/plasmid-like protein (TIGR03299 family)
MHGLDDSTGRYAFAHVGEKAWHGHGKQMQKGATREEWLVGSGLNYNLLREALATVSPYEGNFAPVDGFKAIVRSDLRKTLSVVSDRYKVVQPSEVLDFFLEVCKREGFEMETAGALKGGRVYWALARVADNAKVAGFDEVAPYCFLTTSCDGSLATQAQFTSIRVVCCNTLSAAYSTYANKDGVVRIRHDIEFDPHDTKTKLGIGVSTFEKFLEEARVLSEVSISREETVRFFLDTVSPPKKNRKVTDDDKRAVSRFLAALEDGQGADLTTARGTLWGALNAVTHSIDHDRIERVAGSNTFNAFLGTGSRIKTRAFVNARVIAGLAEAVEITDDREEAIGLLAA